ncbi:hypothetical protein WJX79_010208 [Trebouxia sp. C0005]
MLFLSPKFATVFCLAIGGIFAGGFIPGMQYIPSELPFACWLVGGGCWRWFTLMSVLIYYYLWIKAERGTAKPVNNLSGRSFGRPFADLAVYLIGAAYNSHFIGRQALPACSRGRQQGGQSLED